MLSFYLSIIENDEDKNILEIIYREYYRLMISIALRFSGNEEDAKDIVHDTIMKLFNHLDKLRSAPSDDARNYICTSVENMSRDFLRKKFRHPTEDLEEFVTLEDDSAPLIDDVTSDEAVATIVRCIHKMRETYRSVCELRFIYEMSELEIAKALNLKPKTVNVRIVRGRKELKKLIWEETHHEGK